MKNMKRAIRRHHYSRLKNKRLKLIYSQYWFDDFPEDTKNAIVCIMIDTPKRHSTCLCCGNPRKHLKEITLQEKRNMLNFEEYSKEDYCER
jgi:hypothetical protein